MAKSLQDLSIKIYDDLSPELMNIILDLDEEIFQTPFDRAKIEGRLKDSKPLLLLVFDQERPVALKLGYEVNPETFMSWIGGVLPDYRGMGLGQKLMDMQHQWLRDHGYKIVQTKTMNRFREMLLLNIKNGFDVMDTIKGDDDLRILLQKKL